MTYKIAYWDSDAHEQKERDATTEEAAEIDARKAAAADPSPAKAAFIVKVDADVDAIYALAVGNRATEYQLAEIDAQAFKDAGYTGDVPGSVHSWAVAKGATDTWAADNILATATAWRTAQAAIRAARLARKEGARVAADLAALATVQAQWAGFVAAVRASLGLPAA